MVKNKTTTGIIINRGTYTKRLPSTVTDFITVGYTDTSISIEIVAAGISYRLVLITDINIAADNNSIPRAPLNRL